MENLVDRFSEGFQESFAEAHQDMLCLKTKAFHVGNAAVDCYFLGLFPLLDRVSCVRDHLFQVMTHGSQCLPPSDCLS